MAGQDVDPGDGWRCAVSQPFITLWSGRRWPFLRPSPDNVFADDWHSLAYVNRYGGAAGAYSVLEHLVRGTWLALRLGLPDRICFAYSVHDVPEYVPPSDLLGPVVQYLKSLAATSGIVDPVLAMRAAAEAAVYERCGVLDVFQDPEQAAVVHRLDVAMCAAEKRDLVTGCEALLMPEWAPRERIEPMPVDRVLFAYHQILERFAPVLAAEFRAGKARAA